MSKAADELFEKALDREVNGTPPAEELGIVVVSGKAFDQTERVKLALRAETTYWTEQQDKFKSDGVGIDDARYVDAKETHDLLMESYRARLRNLSKVGVAR